MKLHLIKQMRVFPIMCLRKSVFKVFGLVSMIYFVT